MLEESASGRPYSRVTSVLLFLSAFLASGVEFVEALTIVLALGTARGWRSPLVGAGGAALALAALVGALGPALVLVPIDALRRQSEAARRSGLEREAGLDWYAFTLSFKSVLLEGLEAAFIVITFGSSERNLPLAAVAGGAALVVVVAAGAALRAPLTRVPENTVKFAVGILLTTFGIFWGAEGTGVSWPGDELALLGVLAFVSLSAFVFVRVLRGRRAAVPAEAL
jgi:uncharacterized membrane protein